MFSAWSSQLLLTTSTILSLASWFDLIMNDWNGERCKVGTTNYIRIHFNVLKMFHKIITYLNYNFEGIILPLWTTIKRIFILYFLFLKSKKFTDSEKTSSWPKRMKIHFTIQQLRDLAFVLGAISNIWLLPTVSTETVITKLGYLENSFTNFNIYFAHVELCSLSPPPPPKCPTWYTTGHQSAICC